MTSPAAIPIKSNEILFQNRTVALCLLPNRRHGSMRIIDFRSGPVPVKRLVVMNLARQHGIQRVYTLVERDECSSWARLGFSREGSIPAFYKRSDAYLMGASVPELQDESGVRSAVRPSLDPDRAYQAVRAQFRKLEPSLVGGVKVQLARPADWKRALASAIRTNRDLTRFEDFGRDVVRRNYSCTARGGFSLAISVESQPCFDNAFMELLVSPRNEREVALTRSAVAQVCEDLEKQHIVGCFALSPCNDTALGTVFLANGFRRTAVLRGHLRLGTSRSDALLWSRRICQPNDD